MFIFHYLSVFDLLTLQIFSVLKELGLTFAEGSKQHFLVTAGNQNEALLLKELLGRGLKITIDNIDWRVVASQVIIS